MKEIDMSMGGAKVIFKLSNRPIPPHWDGWTLYDVYIEDKYVGLVSDTGLDREDGSGERVWRPLEGGIYQELQFLNRDEAAASFFRYYYNHKKSGFEETNESVEDEDKE